MHQHLLTVLRKITGVIFILLGVIGGFVPIPVVPFFLLAVFGLGLVGVKPETINKVKLWINKLFKKFLNKNK